MKRIFTEGRRSRSHLAIFNLLIGGLLAPVPLSAAPVLVEAYQEGSVSVPGDKMDTATAVELSFSVDTSCYVLFAAGGSASQARGLLGLDNSNLPPLSIVRGDATYTLHLTYAYPLALGYHTIRFRITHNMSGVGANCSKAYLQALIFLPDEPSTVAEPPGGEPEPRGLSPLPALISRGPYVNVQGATELVDATGRVIENAIEEDKVFIADLPQGTYFARTGERTIVKIVKVE